MKNKKIILITIVFILLTVAIACIFGISKQPIKTNKDNENKVTFEVNNLIANSGEEITITIKMLEDSNFVAANFELLYDREKMEYVKNEKGAIFEQAAMSIINNDTDNNKISFAYVGNPQDETNVIKKGNIANITFKIKESIVDKNIFTEFKCTTLKDKDGNDISKNIKQGTIAIK